MRPRVAQALQGLPAASQTSTHNSRSRGKLHAAWFFGTLCSPQYDCHLLAALAVADRRDAGRI